MDEPGRLDINPSFGQGYPILFQTIRDTLMKRKIRISMGTGPSENAIAERVNGTIKEEFRPGKVYDSYLDAKLDIDQIVRVYNERRPHASIDYLTPDSAHNMQGTLPKRWKAYPPKWIDRLA